MWSGISLFFQSLSWPPYPIPWDCAAPIVPSLLSSDLWMALPAFECFCVLKVRAWVHPCPFLELQCIARYLAISIVDDQNNDFRTCCPFFWEAELLPSFWSYLQSVASRWINIPTTVKLEKPTSFSSVGIFENGWLHLTQSRVYICFIESRWAAISFL